MLKCSFSYHPILCAVSMASESDEEVNASFLRDEARPPESGVFGRVWGAFSTYCVLPFVVGTSLGLGYALSTLRAALGAVRVHARVHLASAMPFLAFLAPLYHVGPSIYYLQACSRCVRCVPDELCGAPTRPHPLAISSLHRSSWRPFASLTPSTFLYLSEQFSGLFEHGRDCAACS